MEKGETSQTAQKPKEPPNAWNELYKFLTNESLNMKILLVVVFLLSMGCGVSYFILEDK
jgi:hypothetical protein